MTSERKWMTGTFATLLLSVVSTGGPAVYYLGSMASRFEAIEKSQLKLQDTLESLIQEDLSDIKQRMVIIETKDILPRAESKITDLERRVRELERSQ